MSNTKTKIDGKLDQLEKNYQALTYAYRRGVFENSINVAPNVSDGSLTKSILGLGGDKPMPFKKAAKALFEAASELESVYKSDPIISTELKIKSAEIILSAQVVSYEVLDYFLVTDADAERHFTKLVCQVAVDVKKYWQQNYAFVNTQEGKKVIVKQLLLAALSGVNVLYRKYTSEKHREGLEHVDQIIRFVEEQYASFCGTSQTSYGLLGLGYFLKGRLLLNKRGSSEAEICFQKSADSYVRKLSGTHNAKFPAAVKVSDENNTDYISIATEELLALRRAALVQALGHGYSALINSKIKASLSYLISARGILHFNAPVVYAAYVELLYWSAKRAESSRDVNVLTEAKEQVKACLKIFEHEVGDSHYPHRAGIELSLILHYLAQQSLETKVKEAFYKDAVNYLKTAIDYADGKDDKGNRNPQLQAEACYILSHILRYQGDTQQSSHSKNVSALSEAYHNARKACSLADGFPRHHCEALLSLCGVYAEINRREIDLTEIDPQAKPHETAGTRTKKCAYEALQRNGDTNYRISGICYLRLVDYYLRYPEMYSLAVKYWKEWEKVEPHIEHAFVKEWAERTKADLDKAYEQEERLIIDFEANQDLEIVQQRVKSFFAKQIITKYIAEHYDEYRVTKKDEIVRKNIAGKAGKPVLLKTDLEDKLVEYKVCFRTDAAVYLTDHELLKFATELMKSYLE